MRITYLEYFDDTFVIVSDIDGFEHFTVLSPTQFAYNLVVILLTVKTNGLK